MCGDVPRGDPGGNELPKKRLVVEIGCEGVPDEPLGMGCSVIRWRVCTLWLGVGSEELAQVRLLQLSAHLPLQVGNPSWGQPSRFCQDCVGYS